MDFDFTEEERMILGTVAEFVAAELAPIARRLDEEGEVPLEAIRKLQEMGLFGLLIPEEYGGSRVSTACYAGVIESISKVCAALAITLSVHNSVGAFPILRFGTEEQKRRYLPRLVADWIGAFSLTEPEAGSDAARLRLKAARADGGYLLDGTKLFVTNGSIADLYLVFGRTDESPEAPHRGISAFLVERSAPGLEVGKLEDKMGLRASDTTELVFQDCFVPAEQRLGAEGDGFRIAMMSLDNGRIGVGAQAVGIGQGAFEHALAHAETRRQFGRALREFEAIQFMLADMKTRLDAARLLVQRAAWLKDRGEPHTKEAAMAKLFASKAAVEVCHAALQIHGGYGYIKEYPVERLYRDARVTELYEETTEMQRLVIARQLLGGKRGA
ncbi:MAG: acyl-CoA dehydrogenase family protein [Candidatus Eisenbacteria bacterium]|nr:acyl-CoA dehydrogenase family protein [Candidatus Eisenbacteria bacterium]